jgi:hypothetical protein
MIDFQTFATRDFEFAGIQSKLFENCGMNIGDIMTILNCVEANLICRRRLYYLRRRAALSGFGITIAIGRPCREPTAEDRASVAVLWKIAAYDWAAPSTHGTCHVPRRYHTFTERFKPRHLHVRRESIRFQEGC